MRHSEDPDDDDDDSWTIFRQFGSNYDTVLDNLETTLRKFFRQLIDSLETTWKRIIDNL